MCVWNFWEGYESPRAPWDCNIHLHIPSWKAYISGKSTSKEMRFFWHFFSRLQKKGDVFEPFKVDPFGIHVCVLAYKQRTFFRCVVFQDFDLPILMWTLFWAGAWSIEKKMQHIKLSNMDCVVIFAFCFFLVPRKARQDISGLTGTCSTATWFAPMMPKFGWMDFGGI